MANPSETQFERIVGPHFEALYRAALRLTRERQDAEDLVQEVCLRAYPELGRLEKLEHARGWLLRVQYRLFVDETRRRRRSPFRPAADDDGSSARMISEAPGPEELAEASLELRRLTRAWAELEPNQRALLALHAEGYGPSELEHITGISRNAIGVRLHRARARLAKLIERECCRHSRLTGMQVES